MASASPPSNSGPGIGSGSGSGPGSGSGSGSSLSLPMHTESTIIKIPNILPRERVFPIQIGGEMFKLSGASLSSDAPSYFSQYFLCQIKEAEAKGEDVGSAIRTLYIDRDPVTFRDIALHLRGYHLHPRDGTHFVRLFADAQFYSLPKLMSQLYQESIFISIGDREFKIPREIFTDPPNSPNYFSLGFAMLFSQPEELFPGLDREGLLRPPSILPPSVPHKNADTFTDILRMLQGYPVQVRDETHRQDMLRDARYFHFKALEQRLIPHSITYNPIRGRNEIALRLENVQKSGISIAPGDGDDIAARPSPRYVRYARPHTEDKPAEAVLEIGGDVTKIHFTADGPRVEFFQDTRARIVRLFEVIATKLDLPATSNSLGLLMPSASTTSSLPETPGQTIPTENLVRALFEADSFVTLDGEDHVVAPQNQVQRGGEEGEGEGMLNASSPTQDPSHHRKKRRIDDAGESVAITVDPAASASASAHSADKAWFVQTGQWRLRIQEVSGKRGSLECVFVAVKLDAVSSERGRNKKKGFLVN